MKLQSRQPRPRKITNMRGFPVSLIIDRNIDLHSFNQRDWVYDPIFNVIFVRQDSKMFTLLSLL